MLFQCMRVSTIASDLRLLNGFKACMLPTFAGDFVLWRGAEAKA